MKYHRLGHIKPVKILKQGDRVCSGDVVGENSTGNGQWAAHVHFDILTYEPSKWTEYVIGKSKEWVIAHYADPRGLERLVLPSFDHLGYGWLSTAVYSGKSAIHSGLDLNGKGSGNDDLGDPVHSPCTGVVRYVYNGTGKNEGWGGMVILEEKIIEEPMKKEFVKAIEELVDEKYGDNLNEKEQEDAAKKIKKVSDKLVEYKNREESMLEELAGYKKREETTLIAMREESDRIAFLEEKLQDATAKLAQSQTTETPDSIDVYSLGELAGAFFRKLISIKK